MFRLFFVKPSSGCGFLYHILYNNNYNNNNNNNSNVYIIKIVLCRKIIYILLITEGTNIRRTRHSVTLHYAAYLVFAPKRRDRREASLVAFAALQVTKNKSAGGTWQVGGEGQVR